MDHGLATKTNVTLVYMLISGNINKHSTKVGINNH